jgi:thioredoxin-like negative regulator of GroEL
MLSRLTKGLLVALVAAVIACAEQPTPAYTRVSGPAPAGLPTRTPVTLVVFWATWCPPCREEVIPLRALARDPPGGLSIVTFGLDESEATVRDYFGGEVPRELGYHPDPERRTASAFGVDVLPAAFLVIEGRLVGRFAGAPDWNSRGMRRLLERLASERKAGTSGT